MKMMFISFCCSRKGFRLFVQAAKQQAVWLSLNCINGKYLWALPTPTTFKKVDQTFIIAWLNCELNHNLPNFKIILYFYEKTHCRGFQVRAKCLHTVILRQFQMDCSFYSSDFLRQIFRVHLLCLHLPHSRPDKPYPQAGIRCICLL